MKLASTIARYLLGLMFLVFGLNGFLNFLHPPAPASPVAVQFMTAVTASHFIVLIFLVQVVAAVLLLANRFVPLALVLLAAVIVNILNYHLTMDPSGLPPGLFAAILWAFTFWGSRSSFARLLQPGPAEKARVL